MQQYTYEDQYQGKPRKLLILIAADGTEYRVFCDSSFLGILKPVAGADGLSTTWKTDYNILKPIAAKIGAAINQQQEA